VGGARLESTATHATRRHLLLAPTCPGRKTREENPVNLAPKFSFEIIQILSAESISQRNFFYYIYNKMHFGC
jgi:hypothetical protein